jgi:hypothetical protein
MSNPTLIVFPALLKSHVDQYTRSDGTVVQAHDDKRVAAAPKAAAGGYAPPKPGDVGHEEHVKYGKYFRKGDKVKDGSGKVHEVLSHRGAEVQTYNGGSFHPTKLDHAAENRSDSAAAPGGDKPLHSGSVGEMRRKLFEHGDQDAPAHISIGGKEHKGSVSEMRSKLFSERDQDAPAHIHSIGAPGGDKRVAANPNGQANKRVVAKLKTYHKASAAGLKSDLGSALSAGDTESDDGGHITYGDVKKHLQTMRAQLNKDHVHAQHIEHAGYAVQQAFRHDAKPLEEKHAKLIGAALSGKTRIDDNGMVQHAPEPRMALPTKKR